MTSETATGTRTALVTGAARGIGASIAERLRADGFRVLLVDRSWSGDGADRHVLDVTDHDAVLAFAEKTGGLDVLVNNAGITRDGFCHKMSLGDFMAVIEVSLVGSFNLCRAFLPAMREAGYGRIVNLSSMNGLRGQMGQANYTAAKAGLIGLTKSIALENASKGITANCIAPGFIATDMTAAIPEEEQKRQIAKVPVGRAGTPDDVSSVVSMLVAAEAGFITGQVLSVNGGEVML